MASELQWFSSQIVQRTLLEIRRARGQQGTDSLDECSGLHCAVIPTRSVKIDKKLMVQFVKSYTVRDSIH